MEQTVDMSIGVDFEGSVVFLRYDIIQIPRDFHLSPLGAQRLMRHISFVPLFHWLELDHREIIREIIAQM